MQTLMEDTKYDTFKSRMDSRHVMNAHQLCIQFNMAITDQMVRNNL